jgi:hypothetical protein
MRTSRQASRIQIITDQKQIRNVEYFSYLGNLITSDSRCTREIKSTIAMAKAATNKKKTLFTSKLDLNLRKKLMKCYICSTAFYDVQNWTLRKVNQKCLERFEMWSSKRMEKITITDRVRKDAVLHRIKKETNILHTIKRRKANYVHILKEAIEGNIL